MVRQQEPTSPDEPRDPAVADAKRLQDVIERFIAPHADQDGETPESQNADFRFRNPGSTTSQGLAGSTPFDSAVKMPKPQVAGFSSSARSKLLLINYASLTP